jgi:hypothetical protein
MSPRSQKKNRRGPGVSKITSGLSCSKPALAATDNQETMAAAIRLVGTPGPKRALGQTIWGAPALVYWSNPLCLRALGKIHLRIRTIFPISALAKY